jgi:hypothetical protein
MSKLTAVTWPNGKAYFFRGGHYIRYDLAAEAPDGGYPQKIADAWPGVFDSDIDAVLVTSADTAYFFRGSEYLRYDIPTDTVAEGPAPISRDWPGLFDSGIDAATMWPNGKAYFFRGDEYQRYDLNSHAVDDGYPQPISAAWDGVFDKDIDTVLLWSDEVAYFFRGDEYSRYNVASDAVDDGYPRPLSLWQLVWAPQTDTQTGDGTTGGTATPQPTGDRYVATLFDFQLRDNETVNERVVRCCEEALADGPMGEKDRHDFYRDFIAANQEKSIHKAEALTGVRTSCAMFVRAVRHWCGAPAAGPYIPGTGMFVSMGNVSYAHPSFVKADGHAAPSPGDWFYISTTPTSNDGHTGIFIEETAPGVWRTAEGGGGDGTLCRFTERTIAGNRFTNDPRPLHGWFDCTRTGLPST